MMGWKLIVDDDEQVFETREELLEYLSDLLEDAMSMSPLYDAEIQSPHGENMDVQVGFSLVPQIES